MAARRRGLREGDVLKGKYKILNMIGKGGMSRVWMASDLEMPNKQWAVKEVDRNAKDPYGDPIEQSLVGEWEILSRIDHPNIVRIVDMEKTKDFIYMVMDHVPGQTLADVVRKDGPQDEADVQRWMLQICDALSYLHSQNPPIIYRDMKPSNVMLHPDGYVKIIDFGIARTFKGNKSQDTKAFGTDGYAPPEQYQGRGQTDPRSDIYALGATMWHLLAGKAPNESPIPDVRDFNSVVGEGFASVIIPKCTKLNREERYQTCDELAADLDRYEQLTRAYRGKQKGKVISFGVAAGLAVVLTFAGFGFLHARDVQITEQYQHWIDLGNDQVKTNQGAPSGEALKWDNLESDPGGAEGSYLQAIKLKPKAIEAYEGLISCYKQDNEFSEEEKKQFDAAYQKNLSELKTADEYSSLCYDIGMLYWNYYSYGGDDQDNQDVRIKAAGDYFKIAAEDGTFKNNSRAKMYANIADFVTNISQQVNEGNDDDQLQETYANYWTSLQELAGRLDTSKSDSEKSVKVRLESCVLIANAMETYMDKFAKVADVSRNDMNAMYETVETALQQTENEGDLSDKDKQRRTETLNRMKTKVLPKITTVYGTSKSGN